MKRSPGVAIVWGGATTGDEMHALEIVAHRNIRDMKKWLHGTTQKLESLMGYSWLPLSIFFLYFDDDRLATNGKKLIASVGVLWQS